MWTSLFSPSSRTCRSSGRSSFSSPLRIAAVAVTTMMGASLALATELTWFGHSAFGIKTPSGKVVLIDPWISNPSNPEGKKQVEALERADLILLTHAHNDHIGDAVAIAEKTKAKLVATFDLSKAMVQYKGFPKDQATAATAGSTGGTLRLLDGELAVTFVPALHGADMEASVGPAAGTQVAAGEAGGFLVEVKGGPTFYHTGDTDVFSDMALISRFAKVDVMLTCIGDKFTMGPERAAYATKLTAPAQLVIPHHYGTFPALTGTAEAFATALAAEGVKTPMKAMKVGEVIKW